MLDSQQQKNFINESFGDRKPWLSQDPHSSSNAPPSSRDFDRVLYQNLVEMVPLVESLMHRRANSSYSRRASLNFTRTPSRDSFSKKISDSKGRKTAQTSTSKKPRDERENDLGKKVSKDNQDAAPDDFSIFSSRSLAAEKDGEELFTLREQLEDLQKKILEKDEDLKTAKDSLNQMTTIHAKLDELKKQVSEKDSLLKSAHLQLSNAKIKLADKQAALEKLEWEAQESSRKAEKLQVDVDSMQDEIATFMMVFSELAESDSTTYAEEKDIFHILNQLPQVEPVDDVELQKMEEARTAYLAAVAAAKEKPSEETLAIAAEARLKLQAFAFGPTNSNIVNGF